MRKGIVRGVCAGVVAAVALSAFLQAASAPLADAAMRGDKDTVRTLLKQGVDVNQPQGDGMTALHWAASSGNTELAEMLLYAGANVRATTRLGGYTPLHVASQAGHRPVIEALAKAGADVNTLTTTGATALMMASASGQVAAVQALLDGGAEIDAKDQVNEETALMFAAALDRADVVQLLLARGAKSSLTAKVVDRVVGGLAPGDEALQSAQRGGGRAQNAAAAGRGGADRGPEVAGVTRPYTYNELIGKQGGLTALHFAARQGSIASVKALVEAGADVNQLSPADKATPLLIAAVNGQFDLANYLLEHGANPNLATDAGATALYAAINVQWGPKSFYPQPRAQLQQKISYLDLMKALLDKGADPNARVQRKIWYTSYNFDNLRIDESGATPFWRAAYASDIDAMKLLVSYGADPNLRTIKTAGRGFRDDGTRESGDLGGPAPVPVGAPGITPLQAAAGAGYGEGYAGNAHRFAPSGMLAAVKYLVEELGADVNTIDHEGMSALHHAASRGDNEMILYLVAKGADVTVVNRRGQSVADMANGPVQRIQPFPETLALLEKLGAKNSHKCVSC